MDIQQGQIISKDPAVSCVCGEMFPGAGRNFRIEAEGGISHLPVRCPGTGVVAGRGAFQ